MSDLKTRLRVELEHIERTLAELPDSQSCVGLSMIELAGVAALLHSFYNGIEKLLKDILKAQKILVPEGANWHRDLVKVAVERQVIKESTAQALSSYLAFRHFFVHAYVMDLEGERLETLIQQVNATFEQAKRDIEKFL